MKAKPCRQYAREMYEARKASGLPAAREILATAPAHLQGLVRSMANAMWELHGGSK